MIKNAFIEANGSSPALFDPNNSREWNILQQHFSSGIRQSELASVAIVLSQQLQLTHLSREAKRTFVPLIQWFHNNWAKIEPVLPFIQLFDDDLNPISGEVQKLKMKRKSPKKCKQ